MDPTLAPQALGLSWALSVPSSQRPRGDSDSGQVHGCGEGIRVEGVGGLRILSELDILAGPAKAFDIGPTRRDRAPIIRRPVKEANGLVTDLPVVEAKPVINVRVIVAVGEG
jgi:hypothetical protein